MGGELVGLPPINPKDNPTMGNLFWEAFPAYLAMGMSSDDYWNGDAEMCVAYRRARKEQLELADTMAWRQGLYFYHALGCTAPLFALKPQKALDYIKPFGFGDKKIQTEESKQDAGLAFVKAWADRVNNMRKNNGN